MNKKLRKAVIPSAGLGTRLLPITNTIPKEMFPVLNKPVIHYILEEAIDSGIKEIFIIINHQKDCIKQYISTMNIKEDVVINFLIQNNSDGLGKAILCAESYIKDEPFAILLGDNVTMNNGETVLKQMINYFEILHFSIIAVNYVESSRISQCGIVIPKYDFANKKYFQIKDMKEKPKDNLFPSNLAILGRYILTPKIFEILKSQKKDINGEVQLTDAINYLIKFENVYGYRFDGNMYDMGSKLGIIKANFEFALNDEEINKAVITYINQLNSNT